MLSLKAEQHPFCSGAFCSFIQMTDVRIVKAFNILLKKKQKFKREEGNVLPSQNSLVRGYGQVAWFTTYDSQSEDK